MYDHLNDAQLQCEIEEYRKAIREATLTSVSVIAGEGRRLEFVGASGINTMKTELRNLVAEKNRRSGNRGGGSLAVEIG